MLLKINTPVFSTDGRIGKLFKVAVDPKTYQITDFIVEKGFLQKRDRIIPVKYFSHIENNCLQLSISSQKLADFSEYHEEDVLVPLPDSENQMKQYHGEDLSMSRLYSSPHNLPRPATAQRIHTGINAGQPVIGRRTSIYNYGEKIGQIAGFVVKDGSHEIINLVLRTRIFGNSFMLPISKVKHMDDTTVHFSIVFEELNAFKIQSQ